MTTTTMLLVVLAGMVVVGLSLRIMFIKTKLPKTRAKSRLIEDASKATEVFPENELEQFAEKEDVWKKWNE